MKQQSTMQSIGFVHPGIMLSISSLGLEGPLMTYTPSRLLFLCLISDLFRNADAHVAQGDEDRILSVP